MAQKYVLVLRICDTKLQSFGRFQWPQKGLVKAPDWDPAPVCGCGLHGLLWGVGEASLLFPYTKGKSKWLIVRVLASEVVKIDNDKVKFPRGWVVFVGNRQEATDYIRKRAPRNAPPPVWGSGVAGDGGTVRVGDCGYAMAGHDGTAEAGWDGMSMSASRGRATAGSDGLAVVGARGEAVAGKSGLALAGFCGKASVEDEGHAFAPRRGMAIAGAGGVAFTHDGIAQAGPGGVLLFQYKTFGGRLLVKTAYVGRGGIAPNVPYRLDTRTSGKAKVMRAVTFGGSKWPKGLDPNLW